MSEDDKYLTEVCSECPKEFAKTKQYVLKIKSKLREGGVVVCNNLASAALLSYIHEVHPDGAAVVSTPAGWVNAVRREWKKMFSASPAPKFTQKRDRSQIKTSLPVYVVNAHDFLGDFTAGTIRVRRQKVAAVNQPRSGVA